MSEQINTYDSRAAIRWKLLTGVSALALTAYVSSAAVAKAADAGDPQIWIELGGQLSRLQDSEEIFAPAFLSMRPSIFALPQKYETPPRFSTDEFGKLTFHPENTGWTFAASIRYGRSASARHVHAQTNPQPFVVHYYYSGEYHANYKYPRAAKFADTRSRNSESHLILDFQAGKDVGLGLFGNAGATSTVSLGVRFAQFRSKSNIALKSDPDWHFNYKYAPYALYLGFTSSKLVYGQHYQSNMASLRATRSFHGVGPSLSWNASVPFAGNSQSGTLQFDWDVNAALLFGRQRTKTQHHTSQLLHASSGFFTNVGRTTIHQSTPPPQTRARNVTVPNVGGSVGLSWQLQNFKMSFGYKADFFFNAIDGGIDARKSENRAFYGPYASVSIGLGD
jgi:iron complex outermembrane recepter protein